MKCSAVMRADTIIVRRRPGIEVINQQGIVTDWVFRMGRSQGPSKCVIHTISGASPAVDVSLDFALPYGNVRLLTYGDALWPLRLSRVKVK